MVDRAAAAVSRGGPPDPLLGRVINDKFKVLSFIARGGMGKVYRAEQVPLGRVCALKVLNANYTGEHDPAFHKRFFLEASLTSKLRHPNTVTIFDYGQTTDGVYYMAMEYLEGYTLHRAIRQFGHLPEGRATHIARQICRSLREAHSLGVVHRDLKPANVYLLEHGDEPDFVKVLDFGLVKDVGSTDSEELTQAGLFMGSPKYMAPEQISGAPIDARTDIYALGIIMYEMVTGKVPFDRPKSLDILMAHMKEEAPPIGAMNPAARVSAALEEAIFRAMAKDPNDRFRSMDEVLAALKRLGPTTGAEPSASLTMDRQSTTGSGPTASRIVRGVGGASAAMSIPVGPGDEGDPEAPLAGAPGEAPGESQAAPREGPSYPLIAAIVGVIAVAASLVYAKMHATRAQVVAADVGTAAAIATPTGTTAETAAAPVVAASSGPDPAGRAAQRSPLAPAPATPPVKTGPVVLAGPQGATQGMQPAAPQGATQGFPPAGVQGAPQGIPPAGLQGATQGIPPAGPQGTPQVKHQGLAVPKAGAAASGPAKPASDCNPSYYYDADGNKHFKPECFLH